MRRELALLGILPFLLAAPASAEEPETESTLPLRRGVEILAQAGESHEASWLATERARIRIRKGAGLAYARPLSVGPRDYELGVWAGRVRGRTYGLAFQLRF